jgi:hypothetical protein
MHLGLAHVAEARVHRVIVAGAPISLIRADIQTSFFGRFSLKVRRLSGLALNKSANAANA